MKTKFKHKSLAYAVIFLLISFFLFIVGFFFNYPEKILYFSAAIISFIIGDYFIVKIITNKKIKALKKLKQ